MTIIAVCIGFALDALLGEIPGLWHPICGIGALISKTEQLLRRCFGRTPRAERCAGVALWCIVCVTAYVVPFAILFLVRRVFPNPLVRLAVESIFCYQIFARRSLRDESMKVCTRLRAHDLAGARQAVSYIVGRDTGALDEAGVTRATVETVAENASDGVIAPMLFLFLGGAPLGFAYKAVNTLDSMVGYKNEKYLYFGWFSAKLDDLFNLIPARLSAFCMIAAAGLVGMDAKNAARIWKRDRYCHASPNSAQTEAVCAGALGIQLGGNACYFGKEYKKPTIGDAVRPAETEDIVRANRLMTAACVLALLFLAALALLFAGLS